MKTVTGDLIALAMAGQFDVIVHGCNCFHMMGAGIAAAIRTTFPEAYEADRSTALGDRAKLGSISVGSVTRDGLSLCVVNAYTQFDFRGPGRKADYDAIARAFGEIARRFPDARIGYPRIGAGLAGGNWAEIAPLIDAALGACDHSLVVLPA